MLSVSAWKMGLLGKSATQDEEAGLIMKAFPSWWLSLPRIQRALRCLLKQHSV